VPNRAIEVGYFLDGTGGSDTIPEPVGSATTDPNGNYTFTTGTASTGYFTPNVQIGATYNFWASFVGDSAYAASQATATATVPSVTAGGLSAVLTNLTAHATMAKRVVVPSSRVVVTTYSISGALTDASGNPLAGMTIRGPGRRATTDSGGNFSMTYVVTSLEGHPDISVSFDGAIVGTTDYVASSSGRLVY
ncbi:MAG: carboxypeptidase-like regulatory domain-containing protein, partial [Thermoplasmata archaeon]